MKVVLETVSKTRKVAVYSTGSVEAQKLLFAHTLEGDLSGFVSAFYDQTVVGEKTEAGSYKKIAQQLEVEPQQVFFVSDNPKGKC